MKTFSPGKQNAFSLVELLSVLAIIAILMSLSVALTPALLRSNRFSQNMLQISGSLEQARQHAIAQNTYVWVAFGQQGDELLMGILESKEGTETLKWDTTNLAQVPNVSLVGKLRRLSDLSLPAEGVVQSADQPEGTVSRLKSMDLSIPMQSEQQIKLTQAMVFTPTGEAKVASKTGWIQFELARPHQSENESNHALVRIAAVTGKINVIRPY